jgi:hypothetical protein
MNGRRKTKTIAGSLALLFLVVLPLVSGQTSFQPIEPEPSRDRRLLKIDMRKYGYKPHGSGADDWLSLAFTKSNDILVAWTTADALYSRTQIRSTTLVPSHLRTLVLNARTGQKEHGGEWPSRYLQATITPVGKESFLICAGDEIRLLSNDFTTAREQVLSAPTDCRRMRVSPSRRSFSFSTSTKSGANNNLFDAESFQPLAEWSSREASNVDFTDSLLVGICRPDFDLCKREFNQRWQPIHPAGSEKSLKSFRAQGPFLVNDSTLTIAKGGEMTVVTLEGAMLFRVNLPKKFSFARIATSTGGKRFAYVETELRGSKSLDMSSDCDDHIVVYDLDQMKAIYTRKVKGGSPWIPPFEEHRNRIALSSDGTLLAILDSGIIEVYQVLVPKS